MWGAAEGLTRMVASCGENQDFDHSVDDYEEREGCGGPASDKPAPFLKKLALMLRSSEYAHMVQWEGFNMERSTQTFVVLDAVAFAKTLLPRFFKHNKLSSFVQQLYTYGFRRVDSLEPPRPPLVEPFSEQPKRLTFEHELFQPSDPGILLRIKRRLKGPPRMASAGAEVAECADAEEYERAALLQEELRSLEIQLDEMRRTQMAREQLDMQRLDSMWHMAQMRLLSQSHWWRGVMAATKEEPAAPRPSALAAAALGLADSAAACSYAPPSAAALLAEAASAAAVRHSSDVEFVEVRPSAAAPQQPPGGGVWPQTLTQQQAPWAAPPAAWTQQPPPAPPPSWAPLQQAAWGLPSPAGPSPSAVPAPRVDPQLLAALVARAARPDEPAEAAAAGDASHSTDVASISLASMACRRGAGEMAGAEDGRIEQCSELLSSTGNGSSSSSATGGAGSRSRDGSVDGDGSADGSAEDRSEAARRDEGLAAGGAEQGPRVLRAKESLEALANEAVEAAAGLRIFGRQQRSAAALIASGSIDL